MIEQGPRTCGVAAPESWRFIGDTPDVHEVFIPHDGSERSRRLTEEVAQMTPGDMAVVAARYLAENHPDDPYLHAYLDAIVPAENG